MSHRAKAVVEALLVVCALSPARGAAQIRCPQDLRQDDAATRFTVSMGAVSLPIGAFLLIRNGSQMGAFRLVSIDPAPPKYDKARYESILLPDKSTSFSGKGVVSHAGEISFGPTWGLHAVYTHTPGDNRAHIGRWTLRFAYPWVLEMSPKSLWKAEHDAGFEFAPTSACQLSEIDATDKRLRWFRWDKTTQINLPLADLPK